MPPDNNQPPVGPTPTPNPSPEMSQPGAGQVFGPAAQPGPSGPDGLMSQPGQPAQPGQPGEPIAGYGYGVPQQAAPNAGTPLPQSPAQPPTGPVGYASGPVAPTSFNTATPGSGRKIPRLFLIISGIIILIGVGLGVFLLMHSRGSTGDANKAAQESTRSAGSVKPMSDLQSVSFKIPSDMTGFTSTNNDKPEQHTYTYQSSPGHICLLTFGTFGTNDLPGGDVNGVIQHAVDKVRALGATITGPTATTPLVLKSESGESYSLPSLVYHVDASGVHEVDHYSLAVLKSGKRAVVARTCAVKDQQINETILEPLDAKARTLTFSKQ